MLHAIPAIALVMLLALPARASAEPPPPDRDTHMTWWREARFGMFIHWGVYAVPAGTWRGQPQGSAAEWIQHIARIPTADYEPLREAFDPQEFDADEWCSIAQAAGMKYIVITSKHHDGFALFDSAVSDWDIMSTPFRRDIMAELADACRRHGLRIGWYHSILDWHHPDYEPKEDWSDLAASDNFEAYKSYLRAQVREILTEYGKIDIMWFDGEWDATWTHADGLKLDALVRELQPDIVVNNRVDKGRYPDLPSAEYAGDFGTPEQHIPTTGLPGVDWETCMTMNGSWGFKRHDHGWKSSRELLQNLVDIASKGGNFLLNVGPTERGRIPGPSVARLRTLGSWLSVNGDSIYGTQASPFEHLPWGRCTMKPLADGGTRLYLHVFGDTERSSGQLLVHGLTNRARRAFLLADRTEQALAVERAEDAIAIELQGGELDAYDTVIVLDIDGAPDICNPPLIDAPHDRFWRRIQVGVVPPRPGVQVRYTIDQTEPTADSPLATRSLEFDRTVVLSVRAFDGATPLSGARSVLLREETLHEAENRRDLTPGVRYEYCEADLNSVREIPSLESTSSGIAMGFALDTRRRDDHFAFRYDGYLVVPTDGMYTLTVNCDDGGLLVIDDVTVVDHDGLHAAMEKSGRIALAAGAHRVRLLFFEKGGLEALDVWIEGPGTPRTRVEGAWLGHAAR